MSDNNRAVFDFGDSVTFGGDIVLGAQVGVSGGVVYGDVVMGGGASTDAEDDE
ncbi:hypothetical protein [Streptomyces venezuelae]|uniref:hypothetical protein n=1 Tax=Streptomyces venezuelae TaxID=54571 RepID=UPI001681A388|nr:hypothetical protein [Streptomyces venezuelae]